MTETLSTGIEVLDRKLDGGLPAGRTVALSASPASQSELFLYEMARVRPTTYLTTERAAAGVRESLATVHGSCEDVAVRRVGPDDPVADASAAVTNVSRGSMLVVDPVDVLERAGEYAYRAFLNELRRRTSAAGGLAVLHCLTGRDVPSQRDRTEYHADVVFSLATTVRGGTLQNRLTVPKFRGGRALSEAVDLDLTADVTVDVTRKIA